jgi:hypothetical protein
VLAEQRAQLVLESNLAVMLLLIRDVLLHLFEVGLAHGESCPIARLSALASLRLGYPKREGSEDGRAKEINPASRPEPPPYKE